MKRKGVRQIGDFYYLVTAGKELQGEDWKYVKKKSRGQGRIFNRSRSEKD